MREVGTPIKLSLEKFNEQLKNTNVLLAHNLDFDMNMVECEYERCDMTITNVSQQNKYCTMKEGQIFVKYERNMGINMKLEELHYHLFGKKLQNLHDAYHDIIVCLRCYMFMNYQIDITEKNEEIRQTITHLECT